MNLFFNNLLSNIPSIPQAFNQRRGCGYSSSARGLDKDTFVKTSDVSFTGRKGSGSTKRGEPLKELDNITCPYSGIKMITTKKMDKIERELNKCSNIQERIEVLRPYRHCMQELERGIFDIFHGYSINYPDKTMNDCLHELKPDCLAELRIEQFKVLDDVDATSNKLDAKTALKVREVTTNARKIILEDREDQIFKRKDLLAEIHEVTKDYPDQKIVEEMWTKASKLPKSTNNFNAFVVKYADRSPQEIAARMLRPSVASIEHIRPANPQSDDVEPGDNSMCNFMLAARDWNSGRGNTPLPEFIGRHPDIPKHSQKYIDDIIKAIHKGKLQDYDWYPYVLKEKLYNESEGLIDLKLDKYKIGYDLAFKKAPVEVHEVYDKLCKQNEVMRTFIEGIPAES